MDCRGVSPRSPPAGSAAAGGFSHALVRWRGQMLPNGFRKKKPANPRWWFCFIVFFFFFNQTWVLSAYPLFWPTSFPRREFLLVKSLTTICFFYILRRWKGIKHFEIFRRWLLKLVFPKPPGDISYSYTLYFFFSTSLNAGLRCKKLKQHSNAMHYWCFSVAEKRKNPLALVQPWVTPQNFVYKRNLGGANSFTF